MVLLALIHLQNSSMIQTMIDCQRQQFSFKFHHCELRKKSTLSLEVKKKSNSGDQIPKLPWNTMRNKTLVVVAVWWTEPFRGNEKIVCIFSRQHFFSVTLKFYVRLSTSFWNQRNGKRSICMEFVQKPIMIKIPGIFSYLCGEYAGKFCQTMKFISNHPLCDASHIINIRTVCVVVTSCTSKIFLSIHLLDIQL